MNEINISIPLHKLQDLMISHVRYSLPRHTYIVSETIHDVKTYWNVLSSNTSTTGTTARPLVPVLPVIDLKQRER